MIFFFQSLQYVQAVAEIQMVHLFLLSNFKNKIPKPINLLYEYMLRLK